MRMGYFIRNAGVILVMGLISGCGHQDDNSPSADESQPGPGQSNAAPQSTYKDESQFIVETLVGDLAKQIFYAKRHQLPDPKYFSVHALEKPQSPFGAPAYELEIVLESNHPEQKIELNVNGPIWAPELYQNIAAALAKDVGLDAVPPSPAQADDDLLRKLTDGSAQTIENEDHKISKTLEKDYAKPELHEQAALLLGAFALREHSGNFYDIRPALCQITAHLTVASWLGSNQTRGINGQMAEAVLFALMNNQATALDKLGQINQQSEAVAAWTRALRAWLTGDYRPLTDWDHDTMIERIAWFHAFTQRASADKAWAKAAGERENIPDFSRIAEAEAYSVETAHDLLRISQPLEIKEITAAYEAYHGEPLRQQDLVAALNQLPGHGFAREEEGNIRVEVIGWGQWAMFLQGQLCHSIVNDFNIYKRVWSVDDDAKNYTVKADNDFNGLRLYPFVRSWNCLDEAEYRSSLDAAARLTLAEPQLIPGYCWNNLWFRVPFADTYEPVSYDRLGEWFKDGTPPGTAYDSRARLEQGGLLDRPDVARQLSWLHQLAPFDHCISYAISREVYKGHPTYAQATDLFEPVLAYDAFPMNIVACTVTNQLDLYLRFMSTAAKLDPAYYFNLGDFFLNRGMADKAEDYYEKGQNEETDSLISASYASWRIRYHLKNGEPQKARAIADAAGEVYSSAGLIAKGEFFEATGSDAAAFEWYAKNEERYNESGPLIAFCKRYKAKTGDTRYDAELQKRLIQDGTGEASLKAFHAPPVDGVLVLGENGLLHDAGMKTGDVIVAVNGSRVHTFDQYQALCGDDLTLEMTLIVWQGKQYRQIKANPPNHLFGVDMTDYRAP